MLYSIVTGILTGTSYIPFPPWALVFALVPLWSHWLQTHSLKKIFWTGWVSQFVMMLIGFHWVAYTAKEFGMLPWPVAIVVLILFCSVASLHFPVAGVLWHLLIRRKKFSVPAQIAGLVLCQGIAEQFFPMLFPWNMGYPWLWSGFAGFQWADVFGFSGLSQITIAANGLLLWAWIHRASKQKVLTALSVFGLLVVTLHFTGRKHAETWLKTTDKASFQIVQGNIGNLEKHYAQWGRGFRDQIVKDYIKLSESLTDDADFVVWPETAYPDTLDSSNPNSPQWVALHDYLQRRNVTLLTGGYSQGMEAKSEYNGFFSINSQGWLLHPPYRKTILLAFGEFFPGGEWFPVLYDWFPTVSKFTRGPGPSVYEVKNIKIGPQICYEGLYPDFSQGLARGGADIIVNLTNDSWFGKTFEPYQHLYMTLARAIENRRPLIRATNTGISTAISAAGEVLPFSPVGEPWTDILTVPYSKGIAETFFTRHGEWLGWVEILLLILLVAVNFRSKTSDP